MTRKAFIEPNGNGYRVGASDLSDPEFEYHGPTAEVYADDTWLCIVTDDHEGHAMLNIEALPMLRRALANIAKERRGR